jgi:hypothetical protein
MAEVIKISLVVSGENNVYEYHRLLPTTYFDVQGIDLFTDEINSLREEVKQKHPKLKGYEEYIRIAAIDSDTGKILP